MSDFAIAGLCLLCWLNGVVFGWAFWELPRLKKRKHDPVAWTDIDFKDIYISEIVAKEKNAVVPLYTTPPQRKPLTDEELRVIENKINPNMRWRSSDEEGITLYPIEYYELVRAIEAAHGIKEQNT